MRKWAKLTEGRPRGVLRIQDKQQREHHGTRGYFRLRRLTASRRLAGGGGVSAGLGEAGALCTCGVEGGDTQGGEGAGAKVPRRWVYSKQVQHDSPTCSTNNVCRSLKVHEERVTEGVLNAKPQGIQPQSNGEAWKGPEQVIRNICISHTRAGKWLEKLTAGGEDRSG